MRPIPHKLLVAACVAWPCLGYPAPAPQAGSGPLQWQQVQRTDAADGSTYTRFTLVGKALASPQAAVTDRPDLVIDCASPESSSSHKGRFLAASLHPGVALKVLYVEPEEIHGTSYFPKVDVLYHTDTAKEEKDQWSVGGDKSSVAVPREALKKMLHGHTTAIATSDAHGAQLNLQFDLGDAGPVEQACGW